MIILMADTCGGLALYTATHLAVPQPCVGRCCHSPLSQMRKLRHRAVAGGFWAQVGQLAVQHHSTAHTPSAPGGSPRLTPASPPDRVPPARALRAAQSLLACGAAQGSLTPNYEIKGHRDVQQTLSPGDQLYEIIQQWPHYLSV